MAAPGDLVDSIHFAQDAPGRVCNLLADIGEHHPAIGPFQQRDTLHEMVQVPSGRWESACDRDAAGMAARDVLGRMTGRRPFERAWMARYIDRPLTVDARATYELPDWRKCCSSTTAKK